MKENIKRLAVFVMIAASAMFVMTMASADDDKTSRGNMPFGDLPQVL